MNRKLITSKALNWPEINDETSSRFLACIENELVKYPSIKRAKNPPKKQREALKKQVNDAVENQNSEEKLKSIAIKSHFLFGINSITRYIENLDKKTKKILCIFVCRSCKPLRILTQHLLMMCSQMKLKAGCLNNLSSKISSLFNINRASAIAILDSDYENMSLFLNEIKLQILPLLPDLDNPIVEGDDVYLKEELIDQTIEDTDKMEVNEKSLNEIFVFNEVIEKNEVKSNLDFLSFGDDTSNASGEKKSNLTSFNDKNFLNTSNESFIISSVDEQHERYFIKESNSKKRSIEFKQFDISIKYANKEKSKEKNILKNKLAEIKSKKKQKNCKNKKK